LQFNSNPMFQASLGLAVLFAAFSAHMHIQPFLRPPDVVRRRAASAKKKLELIRSKELRVAVQEAERRGDEAGASALASRSAAKKRPSLKRAGSSLRRLAGSIVQQAMDAREKSKRYLFDYNKVEMVFLFCSSAVLLAGIMFKSGFYEEGTIEHAVLKWVVLAIIFGCTVLFCFVFMSEMVRASPRAVYLHHPAHSRLTASLSTQWGSIVYYRAMKKKKVRHSCRVD